MINNYEISMKHKKGINIITRVEYISYYTKYFIPFLIIFIILILYYFFFFLVKKKKKNLKIIIF